MEERVCVLCCRAEADPGICGPKCHFPSGCAHRFCLHFASDIRPRGTQVEDEMLFPLSEVQRIVEEAAQRVCFVCGRRGATITCQEIGCDRSFHLPCAVEGGCVTLYFMPYSTFCWEHRPQQQELEAPEDTNCLICMDPVEGRTTFGTMVCPECKNAWFHRACIQGLALRAGTFSFQCPMCQEKTLFLTEMLFMGIRIPVRRASWEDNGAYADLYRRHSRCDATECLCPGGRQQAQPDGPWRLFLCRSCAAVGTHRRCSNLDNSHDVTWECDTCAGPATPPSASSELADHSTAGPAASGQSPASVELASSSPRPSSQAASGQSLGHAEQETSSPSTAGQAASGQALEHQAQESSSPSPSSQMPSAPCHRCPVCEGSSSSSHPGPERRRHQNRCTRQTQTPYTWPRRLQERSRAAATAIASNTRSQAVPRLSQRSPSRETRRRSSTRQQPSAASRGSAPPHRSRSNRAGGPMRVRDGSRGQRRAQAPYARPGRRSQDSRTPAARAGRSPRRQAASRLSQGSPARASHSRSTTRQRPSPSSRASRARQRGSASRPTGPERVRDRSRSQRRAQTPTTRHRRRR